MPETDTIRVTIDGLAETIPAGLTLAQLLEQRGEPVAIAMVERNGEYVRKQRLGEVKVENGDGISVEKKAVHGGGRGRRND